MKGKDLARKGILKIQSYVPGKSIEEVQKELGAKKWIKLASNENLLGPSAKAIVAIRKELPNIYLYPEGPCPVLRKALAEKFGITERMVVVSNGADNLILMIANAFLNERDEVVMADPTFSVYANVTQIMGAKPIKVKLKNFTHDLDSMLKKVSSRTKLIFICNPNNPTGTTVTRKAFNEFLSKLPGRVIVVFDEAYGDFSEDAFNPNGLDYVKKGKQLIVLRTFSKVYGLAGVRIGYGFAHEELIRNLLKVKLPFEPSTLAQAAGIAALADKEFLHRSLALNTRSLRYLTEELAAAGLTVIPSEANFVMIVLPSEQHVERLSEGLLSRGVIVRPLKAFGLPHCLRISTGTDEDNRLCVETVRSLG